MLKNIVPSSICIFFARNKQYLLSLFFLIFFTNLNAQSSDNSEKIKTKIDSLISDTLPKLFKNDDLKSAIASNDQILQYAENLPKKEKNHYKAIAYNIQGFIYNRLREPEKAKDFFNKSIEHARISKSNVTESKAYNNLAILIVQDYKDYDLAVDYYSKALEVLGEDSPNYQNLLIINIAWGYTKKGDYKTAIEYLDRAKEYTDKNAGEREKAYLYHLYGKYFAYKGELEKAEENFSKALKIAESKNIELVPEIYYDYAHIKHQTGNFDEAFSMTQKHIKLKDKQSENRQRAQNEIANAKYEVARFQREKEIAEQKMNNSKTFSIITIISLIVLATFFTALWLLNHRRKVLTERLEKQNQELQIANEKYVTASKQKSQFINTVSHELRTPLYGVIGITSLLLEDKKLNEQQTEYLNSLKFSGDYLLNLINDILLMSKIEVNKIEPILENFDLKELVSNIVNSFRHQTDENENSIYLEIEKNIPNVIYGDRLRLSQILINLIGNATKFTKNGDIWLRLKNWRQTQKNIEIRFEVEDNGMGIPKDKQEEIFENFSQLDTKESAFKGTGLGLPIIKKLVEFYGGEIKLKSEKGKGSLFWFELSFELIEQDKSVTNGQVKSPINVFNKKILIVEDNKINQLVTRKTLENSNFICDIADNGKIALDKTAENHYDIILMDLNMPVMDGLEAIQKIRESDNTTPIILLTASEMNKDDDLVKDIGIQDVLVKPYDTQHFFNVIIENLGAN